MTVSATTNRVSYTGSGTNGPFSFAYPVQTLTDMGAALQNIADGTIIPLTYGVDYTASGTAVANFGYPAGVTISLMASSPLVVGGTLGVGGTLPSTYNIAIFRKSPPTQGTSIPQAGPLPSKPLEASMDELALALQRSYDLNNRALRLADGYTKTFALTLPSDLFLNPGANLAVNATGDGIGYGPSAASLTTAVAAAQAAAASATSSATSASGSATSAATSASAIAGAITTAGDMVVGNGGGAASRLAVGSNGQVLTVVGGLPAWAAATGFVNPMTTAGDLIAGGASGAAQRLAAGTNGYVLTMVSGAPAWSAAAAGFVNPMTTAGDLISGGTGGAAQRLAGGTDGYVLTMVSGAPAWATAAAGFVNPMTAVGDIIIGGTAGAATRLAKTSNGQVLTLVSGSPAWAAPAFSTPQTTKGDTIMFSTIPVAHAVPGDYGYLIADSAQGDGWRSAAFNETQGAPGKNLIQYADFENNATTGWALGTIGTLTNGLPTGSPSFGSGASGNLSLAASASAPIDGAYHMNIVSSAATTQGNMVHSSANVPVPLAYRGKMLTVSVDYSAILNPTNGNFSGTSSNSYGIAMYDVTNLSFIPVTGAFNFVQNSGVGTFSGQFQTSTNTANLRLCLYMVNASSGAITLAVKNFYVGKAQSVVGFAGSDLKDTGVTATSLVTGTSANPTFGTTSVNKVYEARLGNCARYKYDIRYTSAGTSGTGDLLFALPPGRSFDSNLVSYYTTVEGTGDWALGGCTLGSAAGEFQGSAEFIGFIVPYDATRFRVGMIQTGGATVTEGFVSAATFAPVGTSGSYSFDFVAPIAGWSSNVAQSNESDTRIVAAQITGAAATATAGNPIIFPTVTRDTHAAYNAATGRYTVPISGWHDFRGAFRAAGGTTLSLYAYVDAVQSIFVGTLDVTSGLATFAGLLWLNAGQILDIRPSGGSVAGMASDASFSINKLSGSAVVMANESVIASYGLTTAQAVATNGVLKFDTLVKDTHNMYNPATGLFTAPMSDNYEISCGFSMTNSGGSYIKKNGTAVAYVGTANSGSFIHGSYTLPLNQGDTIGIYCDNGSTYTATSANGFICRLSIKRVGRG